MDKRVLKIAYRRLAAMICEDDGAVLVITLAIFFFLFMLVSSVYAIGEAVHRRIELQNTCDAAAYSAAVVQADGLSRMATVNRAMAWTYVQMVRRQMDYVTYRWLKLTYKNYEEDRKAAKKWHFCLLPCDKHHKQEGTGWWCGQGGKGGMDKIRLNYRFEVKNSDLKEVLENLDDSMGDGKLADEINDSSDDFFSDSDDMFKLRDDMPSTKKMVYDTVNEKVADGAELSDKEIEDVYWDVYKKVSPEPPKYVDEQSQKRGMTNPAWEKWNHDFGVFADTNQISENDYVCKTCGKPMTTKDFLGRTVPVDHSKCLQNMMDAFNDAAKEKEKASSTPSMQKGSSKYGWGKTLAEQIRNDKEAIEMMNTSLDAISMNMILGMREAAQEILQMNLPKNADGEISDDFYYTLHVPTGSNPYGQKENGDSSLAGIFSPLYNTEEHETIFLNMMDNEVHNSLVDYFVSGKTGSGFVNLLTNGDRKAGGLDQWFIRTYPAETMISNKKEIKPTGESYHAEGISRSYKNANRIEGAGSLSNNLRSNHVMSIGDNLGITGGSDLFGLTDIFSSIMDSLKQELDFDPSCINRRSRFPEMCRKVDDSVGLVSQYRWCSAKWFCYFVVYPFGITWRHPFFPKFYCKDHGYGTIWITKEFDRLFNGSTRNDYRPCFIGFDDTFIFKGHARIYGDDKDLVDEQYTGTPARPWLLNEKFFGGDGTITVGLARRQRNPWQRIMAWFYDYDAKSPNLSSGLMSLFNVKKDNFLWTASTARAAYRRNSDGIDSGELNYDMKFDSSVFPDALEIDYAGDATSEMKKLRVGCVCDKGDNQARLEKSWNLSTPDWDATLLPVRYSKNHIGKYESWKNGSGSANWNAAANDGDASDNGGVFRMLAGEKWSGFGDNAPDSTAGSNIMGSENIYSTELNSWDELEKLKIY
ncbi:MAG: Tad domain-containing protein [Lentisphaeria bacterium]|nr:Tad domain-containing protein [Lentisphaeria bacterium]